MLKNFLSLFEARSTISLITDVKGEFFTLHGTSSLVLYPVIYQVVMPLQDIAIFMKVKNQWFAGLLLTPVKAPSCNVIWTFFAYKESNKFKKILKQWFSLLPEQLRSQLLVLDGKRIKGASTGANLIHVVELFASESQITLYQERVPDKKNELVALAPILESVDVEGALLSMDAMFTQKASATLIIDKKADYLMCLKGNQSGLLDEI